MAADGRPNPPHGYLGPREQAARGCVLVVLEDRYSADGLVELLQSVGFDGRAVYDGRNALEAACALQPDAVVVDMDAACTAGLEVARHLRNRPGRSDVILVGLTSDRDEHCRLRATGAGFQGLLTKPVHLGPLLQYLVR